MRVARIAPRAGFTLSEMLVVLGVLVVVTALAQPAIRATLSENRLRSAAKQVRVELVKARLKAVQSGVAQRFRYQVGKNVFEVAPAQAEVETAAARGLAGRRESEIDQSAPAGGVHLEESGEQTLPDGVCFAEELTIEPDEEQPAVDEEGWSPPIVFYPNGRTANASIRLKGDGNSVVDVSLRGLTGMATASKPRHEEGVR